MIYTITLDVKMNGVRTSIATTSDRTLAEVFEENNIPYLGITVNANGRPLNQDEFEAPMADLGFGPEVFIRSVKNMDNA